MTTPAKKKTAGRHRIVASEVMKSRTVRMTDAQWEKCQRLGGGQFLREKIDAAK